MRLFVIGVVILFFIIIGGVLQKPQRHFVGINCHGYQRLVVGHDAKQLQAKCPTVVTTDEIRLRDN